jgi:hypothetical protein
MNRLRQQHSQPAPTDARFSTLIRTGLWILLLFTVDQLSKIVVSIYIPEGETAWSFLGFGLTFMVHNSYSL